MHLHPRTFDLRQSVLRATAVALFAGLAIVPAVGAQQNTGDVQVSAGVATELQPVAMTLCDSGAEFGSNLTAGGTTSDSTDTIGVIAGDVAQNEGSAYQWTPTCTEQTGLVMVDAPNAYTGTVCGTENTGTSSLSLADSDLRFSTYSWVNYGGSYFDHIDSYGYSPAFVDCAAGSVNWVQYAQNYYGGNVGQPGVSTIPFFYYLVVDRAETAGTFASTTTWTVTS